MVKLVEKVISSKSVLHETRRKWSEKLKQVDLSKFKTMRTIATRDHARVSLVQLVDHPASRFALKAIQKAKIKERKSRKNILREKKLLLLAESDFIVKLYSTFKDGKHLYFLTEYCSGGDLCGQDRFSEDAAKFYIACTVEALDCLHSLDIVHGDIKPGNIVLDDEGYAKLIDMGLAEKIKRGKVSRSFCGTVLFLPPEVSCIILKKYDEFKGRDRAVDLWALGVVLYTFLAGAYPFRDENNNNQMISLNIEKGIDAVQFSKEYFTEEAIDFIRKLCAHDPKKRLGYESVEEIRKHRWFENFDWAGLRNRELEAPAIPKLEDPSDTQNFAEVSCYSGSESEADESDWDKDF